MSRSKSSGSWLKEHFDDPYVKLAKEKGYRSRASFKLLDLQEKDRLFKKGMTVVDLGAAPGGWSQIAAQLVGDNGRVVASDILPMDALAGVEFVQGDFTEESVLNEILAIMDGELADLVISDMAPNMSGSNSIDQPASMYLVELALEMAKEVLKPKGSFVAKVFQGEGFDQYVLAMRATFDRVVTRKPDSSRARSREVYIIGQGFK
ncbi:23S rRNA (uridine(2552)-2'-O)-methyltransferase RlmE [Neptunomonas antarctica]|uniref:Ribosomal RNA large subunit methyltransferase E n=1 Tax=Neptunomonas antarctica TaxID=619304 RepID=A0A1N7PKY1_9GAMM|nr:23S rRNA (uridine(2552)-2'-O)-methyltransferase RlmE [Neptunomonas antarctica]SIT11216.1 23S rRNA Um-2552 2'-O-methyltransferase [Neptunomonas antarctica]